MKVTREMLSAAHAVTISSGVVLSWKMLEEIYLAMEKAAPKIPCHTCQALARSVMCDQVGNA